MIDVRVDAPLRHEPDEMNMRIAVSCASKRGNEGVVLEERAVGDRRRHAHEILEEDPAAADEEIDITCTDLSDSVFAPRVAIGGRIASVVSITRAHHLAGVSQVRVRVPRGIASGPAIPVRLFQMDRPTNAVTIAVR